MKSLCPDIIRNGNKIFQLKLHKKKGICPEIVFKDSFNFLSLRLEDLPKTLKLEVRPKLFFPHDWNRPENMNKRLKHLLDRAYYHPERFESTTKMGFFRSYYALKRNTPFCLSEALNEYCGLSTTLFTIASF